MMDSSDSDEYEKNPKKSLKRELDENDAEVSRKPKKKIKREHSPGTGNSVQNNVNYNKKTLPSWLEITDSEDEFQKPKEKPKNKKKVKNEDREVASQEESSFNDVDVEPKPSPKKKKKKHKQEQNEIIKQSVSSDDEKIHQSPKKKEKKKRRESVASSQNEDTIDEQYSDHEIEDKNKAVKSKVKKDKKKQKNSPLQNLFAEHEPLFSETDDGTGNKVDSPVKSPKKLNINDDNLSVASSPKKSPKKKKQEPTPSTSTHEEVIEQEAEPPETAARAVRKTRAKKSAKNVIPTDPPEDANQSSSKPPAKKRGRPPKQQPTEENGDVPRPNLRARPKRITKVPHAELVTVGEEFKLKRRKEKNCRNCNQAMKIKIKVTVRDIAIQTRESCVINVLKKPPIPRPRVKTEDPVSVEDRVVLPPHDENSSDVSDLAPAEKGITRAQVEQLRNMTINLKHEVLPQHQIEHWAGSRVLQPSEREEFEKYCSLKKGVFNSEEDEILVSNWTKFCRRHDWDPEVTEPFQHFRHKGAFYLPKTEERKKFVQCLAHGLPNRSLYSVIQRFRKLYSKYRTDRYTAEEDDILMRTLGTESGTKNNRSLTDVARKLNRSTQSVWTRHRLLVKKRNELKNL